MRGPGYSTLFFILLFISTIHSCGVSQTALERELIAKEIEAAVNMPDFTFKANHVYPSGHKSIYLSPYFTVKVFPDRVEANLPYYGRVYRAPVNPGEGGIRFISTNFEYQVGRVKKSNSWLILISIADPNHPVTLKFEIWDNGNAHLNLIDLQRQSISYSGNIVIKEKAEAEEPSELQKKYFQM